eukprot:Blabericola_migrator_1__7237@NODE_3675_length_1585_cov_148_538208_g2280_i0_p2_GENE_NODE_3675_length_1585_cov_148_538208_g2280_i0NODE_3675_length_1585_cov_148_538208_g2280_i0_p2_ORF_typecomplete_len128_score9_29FliC_SP/PF12613_8/0_03Gal_Lectin/PF02140_18/0_041Gal_Lectin/PF02140_18/8_7e03_NODE_3675_length_1585_cov_148_538208_g2280_i030413
MSDLSGTSVSVGNLLISSAATATAASQTSSVQSRCVSKSYCSLKASTSSLMSLCMSDVFGSVLGIIEMRPGIMATSAPSPNSSSNLEGFGQTTIVRCMCRTGSARSKRTVPDHRPMLKAAFVARRGI